tara:strand:+ start:1091 stop:1423 length:333 start_codon:yes stop_codon:yes gene_type:complete
MRKRRINKKLHRYWLEMEIIDLSQVSSWRRRLFDSKFDDPFLIDSNDCEGLSPNAIEAINKYGLEYTVSKIPADRASDDWIASGGMVVFEFRAREYPSVMIQTGNNPDAV